MDKVCFTQYIPSNKCEIKGYDQISQDRPVQNSIQAVKPEQNTDKPSSNNNKTLNWTIGLGAAATLIALGVIAGRKGHLGDSIQEFLGGAKKTIWESTSDSKPSKHLPEETPARPLEETSTGTSEESSARTLEETSTGTSEEPPVNPPEEPPVNPPEGQPTNPSEGQPASAPEGQPASVTEGQPASATEGQPASATEGQPASTSEGQPAVTPEGQPASTNGEPLKILPGEENSEVYIEKPDESLVPSGKNSQISDEQPELQIETQQLIENEPPASIEKPVAAESAGTSAQNFNGSHSHESERLSGQSSGNVDSTPSPQPQPTSPRKPDTTPSESDKPPVKPVSAEPKKNETAMGKFKRLLRDPFGRKAKAKAELERQKQEAAEMAEEERLLAIKEQKAMEERIKLYPNMGIKQLEEHYAAHENFKEREIIYKHIQKQRFALQTKMDEKYSRMSKEQLFEELEKLQAVKADERDYDAIIIIKNQLKQKGHIVDDKLFEGHKPIEIVPYGEVGDDFNKLVNKRSSDYQGLAPTPDFLIPDFIRVSNYKISSGSGYENYFESSKYGGMYLWNNGGGMQYNWDDKGRWCVEHVLLNGERNEKYYATVLSYSNGNFMSRPHGSFAFAIPGDISKETLEKIRNYFIESGMAKEVVNSSFNRRTTDPTKILDKMIEAVLDIVNK